MGSAASSQGTGANNSGPQQQQQHPKPHGQRQQQGRQQLQGLEQRQQQELPAGGSFLRHHEAAAEEVDSPAVFANSPASTARAMEPLDEERSSPSAADTTAAAAGAAAGSAAVGGAPSVAALLAEGFIQPGESFESLKDSFLLLDLEDDMAAAAAQAVQQTVAAAAGSSNGSSSCTHNSVQTASTESRGFAEAACARLCAARQQQQQLQQLLDAAPETLLQLLRTKKDWERLAGVFFDNFYGLSRAFWAPQQRSTDSQLRAALPNGGSNSSNRGASSSSSNILNGCNGISSRNDGSNSGSEGESASFPVDLEAVRRFYSGVLAAARATIASASDGNWDPIELMLERINSLCCVLLRRASSLRHPQQLAFIPILLECPFLEESVDFSELAKLCEVVASLPHSSRRTIAQWYVEVPASHVEQHITVVQQLITVRMLSAGPLESWHYLQAAQHPAETALRSALQLLHLLYVANVNRHLRRLQLRHWKEQNLQLLDRSALVFNELPADAAAAAAAGGTAAASEMLEQQQLLKQQQEAREVDFTLFHNDAINSNSQLLQHEFALWLRLRRGIAPRLLQQALQQRQQGPITQGRRRGQQQQDQNAPQRDAAPAAEPSGSSGAASAAPTAAGGPPAETNAGAATPRSSNAATAAAAGVAAEVAPRSERAWGSAVRSMSVDSLFSVEAEAMAALRPPSDDAAAGGPAEGPGGDAVVVDTAEDSFSSNLLRTVAAAAAAEGFAPVPSPFALSEHSTAAAALAAGVASPVAAFSSPAAAAAASAANAPFSHFSIPERSMTNQAFSLLAHPFVLDASVKADILRRQAAIEQQYQARQAEMDAVLALCTGGAGYPLPFLYLRVRRSHLVQDTLQQIACNSSRDSHINNTNLRKALKIKFIGEEGVDQGGVTKEFFQLLVDELFSPDYGMFSLDEESQMHWFCPYSLEGRYRFELIGILCGLAINNAVLMPMNFPLVLFKKLLGWPSASLEDLYALHPQVARSLVCVLRASREELESMGLTFNVASDFLGQVREDALGSHDPSDSVTIENRDEYVQLYLEHVLDVSVREQYSAFEDGFYRCVDKTTISLFRPEELQLLLLGKEEELDVSLLQKAATYQDGYTKDSRAISMFWNVCQTFTQEEKKKLLMFITGSDRVPLGGPQALRLTIGRSGPDTERLPTAHTCFNFLLLPDYSSEEKMARLLLIAIQNCTGFGLRPRESQSGLYAYGSV
ncbi:E3 ubiquitin-protein ligase, putative [Eimeria necatrix]|uniref:HECT-type E3 ubiquitin transferase n=1 Tax=Eimeria necatrix TaxID=51315 RepID=U6N179_9EIME|nr:E3 ubiquitin-protein ligase, putative [Eimeria necatrix]CDJ67695.1 E3 ubiquitin-protein ligase, putative [Eimeria necatrix]